MDIEIYTKDFSKDINAAYTPKSFVTPALPCKAGINLSSDLGELDFNLLRSRLATTLTEKKLPDNLIAALVQLAKTADDDIGLLVLLKPESVPARLELFKQAAQAKVKEFSAAVTTAFGDSWVTFVKDRPAYKTYKMKIAIDVTVASVSLAASIASLATAATPAAPVTLILGLYGIIKNGTKLIIVTRNAMMEAETVAAELTKDVAALKVKLDKLATLEAEAKKKKEEAAKGKEATDKELVQLEKDAKDAKKAADAAKKIAKAKEKLKEFAVAFANKLTGDAVGVKIATIEGIASKCGLYGNKCRGIQENTRELAKTYLLTINQMVELGTYCDALEAHFVQYANGLGFSKQASAEVIKMGTKIKTARTAWMGMQQAMTAMNADIEASETRYTANAEKSKTFGATAKSAQEAFKTANWAEAGRWCGVAVDIGLTAGATGSSAWAGAEKAATTSMKLLTIFEKEAITELKKKM